ncbi:MAG: 2-C-methyl-D-erythritol 4-phosphate cytidylyltransferase [Lentisphaerae bacterium RIFOXYC12_FULL_60_16]|nr:MAG: 2-C-methyl-D-erythritol 4-phosphate cytidylyltransferase [Lentisphaerae bacterium RIFOXYC12_FULL_60_16]
MNYAVVVAAGKSTRMGANVDKAFLTLGAKPVLAYSMQAFESCPDIHGVILVVRKDRLQVARGMVQMLGFIKVRKVVAGGLERQHSVQNGLDELGEDVSVVAVHDGARPCVTPELISETIKSAKRYGSGVAGVKITDTVKSVERGMTISKTVDRSMLWAVQTPQTFQVDILRKALAYVKKKKLAVTDEASAVELMGEDVRIVPASSANIKITSADDLMLAAALMRL